MDLLNPTLNRFKFWKPSRWFRCWTWTEKPGSTFLFNFFSMYTAVFWRYKFSRDFYFETFRKNVDHPPRITRSHTYTPPGEDLTWKSPLYSPKSGRLVDQNSELGLLPLTKHFRFVSARGAAARNAYSVHTYARDFVEYWVYIYSIPPVTLSQLEIVKNDVYQYYGRYIINISGRDKHVAHTEHVWFGHARRRYFFSQFLLSVVYVYACSRFRTAALTVWALVIVDYPSNVGRCPSLTAVVVWVFSRKNRRAVGSDRPPSSRRGKSSNNRNGVVFAVRSQSFDHAVYYDIFKWFFRTPSWAVWPLRGWRLAKVRTYFFLLRVFFNFWE